MSKARWGAVTGLALVVAGSLAGNGQADTFAYSGKLELGRPPRTATIGLKQVGDQVELEAEGARVALPISNPERADLQSVRLANGASVGLVRITAAQSREAAAVLSRRSNGRVEVLWAGALDARGDPGERRGHIVELQDQTGDGQPDVVVGDFDERARICGQARTLLRPHAVDPESLRLRPVVLARLPALPAEAQEVLLAEQSPGPTRPPLLRSLRLVGVSSQPGSGAEPWLATLPSALTDGDPATFWSEGHGGGGRGEFATFQFDGSGYDIHALALVPVPSGMSRDHALSVPRTLWLVGDDGTRIKLRFPDRVKPGERYWVAPPKPLSWRCVSVVFEESTPPSPSKPGAAGLAEVEAYTELDFGGGIDRLVQHLSAGGPRAGDAAQVLSTLGASVVPKLQKVWPTLPSPGRRRAVRVLAGHAEADASARELLTSALDDGDADVRSGAFDALIEAGPQSRALLAPRIAQSGEQGDAAALALARRAPVEIITALLAALEQDGGSERTGLREAIGLACRAGGVAVVDAARVWAQGATARVPARSALALALSAVPEPETARPLALDLVVGTAPAAEEFADRWRLVQASRALPASADIDAWLASLAKDEERWMLRAAALETLAERKAGESTRLAAGALRDPYPRVRAAAATALASYPEAQKALSDHALRDRWPMVRAAALEALAGQPGALPLLRKGVADASRMARAAAIRGLIKVRARDAWPLVKERLESKEEWPEVLAESVRFAGELCVQEAQKPLLALVRRGMKPDAWEPDAELGLQALEACRRLGGEAAKSAVALANSGAAPASYRAAAEAPPPAGPACAVER